MNTVNGMPENVFRAYWVSMLWQLMSKTGKGYRRPSTKNRPPAGASRWRGERRIDKPGTTKTSRAFA